MTISYFLNKFFAIFLPRKQIRWENLQGIGWVPMDFVRDEEHGLSLKSTAEVKEYYKELGEPFKWVREDDREVVVEITR